MEYLDTVTLGDCREALPRLPDACVDLVMTSPPYGKQRKNTYGGIEPSQYVDWFLPISAELYRVLKPSGSFVLNIKEHCENGERHTYVLELILALRRQGWLWTEEYIWSKTTAMPGKWPNRFRDAWERCLHFTKERRFAMYQDAVLLPAKESSIRRANARCKNDDTRMPTRNGSGFGKNVSNFIGREVAYPTNVLALSPESGNQGHSAAYPEALPDWFIRLFTQEGDTVIDPFMGSGTTAVAALKRGRHYIGFDAQQEAVDVTLARLASVQPSLLAA